MRLPAPSFAVESVLGAALVVLGVVVAWPDPPPRPKPTAPPPGPARPAQVQAAPPAPVPARNMAREALDAAHQAAVRDWGAKVAAQQYQVKIDRVRAADVRAVHLMATLAGTVGAFEQTPGKNAAWADLARAALDARARLIVSDRMTGQQPPRLVAAARAAVARAVAAGCDDPLVAYWRLRDTNQEEAPDPAAFRDAAERVYASRYPAARRLHAVFNWLVAASLLPPDHPLRADGAEWEDRFWEVLAAAAGERDLTTDEELVDIAARWQIYRKGQGRSREQALSELDRRLRRAGARDYLRLTVRGSGLVQVAWDARGTGVAATVTEAGWQVFTARLQDAREVLVDAAQADPAGYSAPTAMLTVCMGMGIDREEMEYTFRQAMAANPDNWQACWTKLEILHPKWQGSPDGEDYLTFAWALTLSPGDDWLATAVLHHVVGNMPVSGPRYEAARQAVAIYYSNPPVWELVRAAADRTLAGPPADRFALSLVAKVAFLARRHELAREYFGRIGADFSPLVFADRVEYEYFYRESGAPVGAR